MAKSVRDTMTADPHSIGASASVVEAARLMREEHIGSLPVTEDEQLVGMITDRDLAVTRTVGEAQLETVETYRVVMVIERGMGDTPSCKGLAGV